MTKIDVDAVLSAIKSVLPEEKQFIALHEPLFEGNEWAYVKDCLDTGWVSSVGKYVDQFERMLEDFTGVKKAVAVVNGTAALHVCLKLVDVQPGDEVLIPALTFIATANATTYCGAIPHFIDSNETTLGVDPDKLNDYLSEIAEIRAGECYNKVTNRRIKAVVPMHTFGHPVDLEPLMEVCARFKLELVEDAAESLGSYYKGQHTGAFAKVSALSFNGNKIVTTGGGGAILTNDEMLAKKAKHITTTAKVPHKWEFVHDQVGFNYRLPNLNAALGCAQMEKLPAFISHKRELAHKYDSALQHVSGLDFFKEPSFAKSNYWLNVILLHNDDRSERDRLLQSLNDEQIMSRPAWTLLHKLDMFADCPRMDLNTAESLEQRLINIPSSVKLGG